MRRFLITGPGINAQSRRWEAGSPEVVASGVVFSDGKVFVRSDTGSATYPTFDAMCFDVRSTAHQAEGIPLTADRVAWLDSDDEPLLGYSDGLERAAVFAEMNLRRTASGFVAQLVDELRTAAMEARQ